MSYERTAVGGLGWSELGFWQQKSRFVCSGSPTGARASRQICFIDNDPLEQATAERSGCTRSHRPWFGGENITECRTAAPGNNPGHVWCCPANSPQPIPTTPEQRARDTELMLAEQRAAQEGRLPSTNAPAEVEKEPTIEIGRTQPVAQQETVASTLTKLGRNPGWIAAVAALGVGGYLAYRYFVRPAVRRMR